MTCLMHNWETSFTPNDNNYRIEFDAIIDKSTMFSGFKFVRLNFFGFEQLINQGEKEANKGKKMIAMQKVFA